MTEPVELLLHDRNRPTPLWVENIATDQVVVFFSHLKMGHAMRPNGVTMTPDEPGVCYVFPSFEEALTYCENLVLSVKDIRCELYDHRGKSVPPMRVVMDAKNTLAVTKAIRFKYLAGISCFAACIPLFYWDYHSGGKLFLPTLFGINLMLVSLRLLWWAAGESEAANEMIKTEQNRQSKSAHG